MRVLHVVTAFPRSPDDVITPWMVQLLGALRARGVEAEVLAPSYRGGTARAIEGIPVHRFRYGPAALETLTHDETVPDRLRHHPVQAALLPGYLAGGTLRAARLGRGDPGYDVVHVHWPMPHALMGAALRRASGGRTALVCSYYSVEIHWVRRRLPWLLSFLRWTARTADRATAISSATAREVQELGRPEVDVIPFAAALDAAETESYRAPFSGEGPLELLFVGRLVERKGVEVAVRALSRIVPRREARLTVVGEGSREPVIRAEVERLGLREQVRFTGFLSSDELRRAYASCDAFLLPAVVDRKGDTEGLGVVLLEALRFRRPVVASDVGGIPDIVRDGETGWLVPPGDPAALASRVLALAAEPGEARRVADAGSVFARERFSWERIGRDLEGCYAAAVRARRVDGGGEANATRGEGSA